MRLGRLDKRAQILSLNAERGRVTHAERWVGVRAKDAGDVSHPTGLRSPALVEVRARYANELQHGRYLCIGSRLLYIASPPRDPTGTRAELVMSCAELVGHPAEYRPQGGSPTHCRVYLAHLAPYLDDAGQVTDYKTRAEVAVIEVGRPETGDQLFIDGILFSVIGYARDSDDGVVRGLWLEREQ